jgi:hypothetical protein
MRPRDKSGRREKFDHVLTADHSSRHVDADTAGDLVARGSLYRAVRWMTTTH